MARKWLLAFPPPVEPPPGHKHRFRVRGRYKGLPILRCQCGKELVPAPKAKRTFMESVDRGAEVRAGLSPEPRPRTEGEVIAGLVRALDEAAGAPGATITADPPKPRSKLRCLAERAWEDGLR